MGDTYHVEPTNDLKPHNTGSDYCRCMPRIELVDGGGKVVVHSAWDGREFYEEKKEYAARL